MNGHVSQLKIGNTTDVFGRGQEDRGQIGDHPASGGAGYAGYCSLQMHAETSIISSLLYTTCLIRSHHRFSARLQHELKMVLSNTGLTDKVLEYRAPHPLVEEFTPGESHSQR